jgi:hypothetical protein
MENLVYNTWRGRVVAQICCWIQDGSYPPLISFDLIHHAVTVVSANWFNPAPLTLRWTRHFIRDCFLHLAPNRFVLKEEFDDNRIIWVMVAGTMLPTIY